jgi:DNA invertase Pin-like site-specific DNA recombinase
MSKTNSAQRQAPLEDGVAYWRMSSSPQEKSIPQQRSETLPRAKLAGVNVVREFKDEGISGGGMKRRDDFLDMLRFCQERAREGRPIRAVVCYDTSRFSRATSIKTARYIDEFMEAGVFRLLTWERWFDFRKEEDRAIFLLQQDFTNNRYLRDNSRKCLRGMKDVAVAGYFVGGCVPYGFDRLLLDERGDEVARVKRGEAVRLRKKDGHEVLAPIPEDDPDPGRQLQRQTAAWLYQTFASANVSYRWLAEQLNARGVPGPGSFYHHQNTTPGRRKGEGWERQRRGFLWNVRAVRTILTNPVYAGTYRVGVQGKGKFHRLVEGEVKEVEEGAPRARNTEGFILTELEAGGLIDRATWERVQEKIRERVSLKVKTRVAGYSVPVGVLRCGHCGGRMYGNTWRRAKGGKVFEYRKYVCGTIKTTPGACRHYAVDEKVITDLLIDQLLDVYTAPGRLEGVRRKLRERVEAKHRRAPADVERLRRRLAALDAEIRDAARNVLRAKDNVDLLNEALSELRKQRDRVARDLAAAEQTQAGPADEAAGLVDQAVDRLLSLREQLKKARKQGRPELLGEVIRQMVSRVDVYFEPAEGGKRRWFRFAKAAIKLRPVVDVTGCDTQSSPSLLRNCVLLGAPGRGTDHPSGRPGADVVSDRHRHRRTSSRSFSGGRAGAPLRARCSGGPRRSTARGHLSTSPRPRPR